MIWNKIPKRNFCWTVNKHLKTRYVRNLNVFLLVRHKPPKPSTTACGWEVFQILLWKDDIFKHVCACLFFCALQDSIMMVDVWLTLDIPTFSYHLTGVFLEGFMPSQFSMEHLMFQKKIRQQITSIEPFYFKLAGGLSKLLDVVSNYLDLVICKLLMQVFKIICEKCGCGLPHCQTNENFSQDFP